MGPERTLGASAGHDVNYIGLTGALGAIGPRDGPPALPLNLLGDYGGGALYLVVGVLAALREIGRDAAAKDKSWMPPSSTVWRTC